MLRVGFIYLFFLKTNLLNLYTKFHKANKTSEQKRSNEIWSGCEGPLGIDEVQFVASPAGILPLVELLDI